MGVGIWVEDVEEAHATMAKDNANTPASSKVRLRIRTLLLAIF